MDKKRLFHRFESSRFTRKAEARSEDEEYLKKVQRNSFRLLHHVDKAKQQVGQLLDMVFGKTSSPGNRITAIAALLYFISPLDFIPDVIPGLGFTDDIAIIGMVLGMITSKVVKYQKERPSQDETNEKVGAEVEIPKKQSKKKWLDKSLDGLFDKVGKRVERTTQESIDKRMKAQLIIVSISLGGAILAALITLLLKYVFKVF